MNLRHIDKVRKSDYSSSSSCSGRISFDSCSLYPQNEIGTKVTIILNIVIMWSNFFV